jgi:hypothetical protein
VPEKQIKASLYATQQKENDQKEVSTKRIVKISIV